MFESDAAGGLARTDVIGATDGMVGVGVMIGMDDMAPGFIISMVGVSFTCGALGCAGRTEFETGAVKEQASNRIMTMTNLKIIPLLTI